MLELSQAASSGADEAYETGRLDAAGTSASPTAPDSSCARENERMSWRPYACPP